MNEQKEHDTKTNEHSKKKHNNKNEHHIKKEAKQMQGTNGTNAGKQQKNKKKRKQQTNKSEQRKTRKQKAGKCFRFLELLFLSVMFSLFFYIFFLAFSCLFCFLDCFFFSLVCFCFLDLLLIACAFSFALFLLVGTVFVAVVFVDVCLLCSRFTEFAWVRRTQRWHKTRSGIDLSGSRETRTPTFGVSNSKPCSVRREARSQTSRPIAPFVVMPLPGFAASLQDLLRRHGEGRLALRRVLGPVWRTSEV